MRDAAGKIYSIPLLDRIKMEIEQKGIANKKQESRMWLQRRVRNMTVDRHKDIMANRKQRRATPEIGKLYFFVYDAKWKKKLPYWDAFPLIFPFEFTKDGFYGINLHYLKPNIRIRILAQLMRFVDDTSLSDKARLRLSYMVLKSFAGSRFVKPMLKRYLWAHVRSPFSEVKPSEWEYSLFLPVENFQKKPKEYVWRESSRIAGTGPHQSGRRNRRRNP